MLQLIHMYLAIIVRASVIVCAARGSYLPKISNSLTPLLNVFLRVVHGDWPLPL